jgi:hypothetical protein
VGGLGFGQWRIFEGRERGWMGDGMDAAWNKGLNFRNPEENHAAEFGGFY